MKQYEAMVIFPDELQEDALEQSINWVKSEIEQQGGRVENMARLGKKRFARPQKKRDAGTFVVMNIEVDGDKLDPLRERFGRSEDVFRVQFVKAPAPSRDREAAEAANKQEA